MSAIRQAKPRKSRNSAYTAAVDRQIAAIECELESLRQRRRACLAQRDGDIRAAAGTLGQLARRFALSREHVRRIRRTNPH